MARAVVAFAGVPRVNLMPRSEVERREREGVMRGWVWGVLGAIIIAVLIIAGALVLKLLADQRLAAEQARSASLTAELASLSDVSQALATESELTDFRAQSMGADFAWSPLVQSVVGILPAGAALTGFDITSGGIPQGDDPSEEIGSTGTIAVESPTPIDIVATIRQLRQAPNVYYADGQSVTASSVTEGYYAYVLTVVTDQNIYSGAFAEAGEE